MLCQLAFTREQTLCSKKITGSSLRIADAIKPTTSAGGASGELG